jgi:hypothetical protein
MKKRFTLFWIFLFVLALLPAQVCFADWQIYYSGKAAKMFGGGGRGNFATRSQCESYRTSRPGFESMNSSCSGSDRYVPPPPPRAPSAGSSSPSAGVQPAPVDPAVLEAQRQQEEQAAKQREQVAAMEKEADEMRKKEFEKGKGTLGGDLRNRFNASYGQGGAMSQLELSACWSKLAARADQANAKKYADYAIAAREGKAVPACHAEASRIPEPPAPTWVPMPGDDVQTRVIEEEKRLKPLIANLQGRTEKTKAAAEKKRSDVETLEKKSQSARDPKEKQEADTLLAEAKKALEEAREEDRKASEELSKAQNELKALNDLKVRAGQGQAGASASGKVTQ